jgi:hypothetical protein
MTRVEKIFMVILLLLIIGTVVFWSDVRSVFTNKRSGAEKEYKNEKRDKKDKKDKDDDGAKKDDKDESNKLFFLLPGSC